MSNYIDFILVFIIAGGTSYLLTPLAKKIAHKVGAIDIPKDNRRVHVTPIPRLGGLAIYVGTVLGILYLGDFSKEIIGLLVGGTVIVITGVMDDIFQLSAKFKLLFQVISAVILFGFGYRITFLGNPLTGDYIFFPMILSLIVTVIWIVGITNTINLIDGLDGLAAGVAVIASASLAYIAIINGRPDAALITLAVSGSALGFLPHNFNPAKIFMGDAGSLFLGYMLAAISIMGTMKGVTVIATVVPILALGLPIFDTAFAILRRLINKKPIMEADKGHLHHRILSQGLGHKKTVILLYSLSGILGVAAVLINRKMIIDAIVLIIFTLGLVFVFSHGKEEEEIENGEMNGK